MREWTICQFEWYRDNIVYITVSNRKVWGGFCVAASERYSLLTAKKSRKRKGE